MIEVASTEYLEKLALRFMFQKKTREPEGSLVVSTSKAMKMK